MYHYIYMYIYIYYCSYVSRQHVLDSTKHVVLGMQQFKPTEFAQQINLKLENAWGILRCIIDICMKLKQGKYLIMKDPNKVCCVSRVACIGDDLPTLSHCSSPRSLSVQYFSCLFVMSYFRSSIFLHFPHCVFVTPHHMSMPFQSSLSVIFLEACATLVVNRAVCTCMKYFMQLTMLVATQLYTTTLNIFIRIV